MSIDRNVNNWSFETDIVVVGSGGCGLTAGIAAALGGVEAIIFEKQDRPWSNTARSGGMIPAAGTSASSQASVFARVVVRSIRAARKCKHFIELSLASQ